MHSFSPTAAHWRGIAAYVSEDTRRLDRIRWENESCGTYSTRSGSGKVEQWSSGAVVQEKWRSSVATINIHSS
jgi:hypothetical protein